MSQSSSTTYSTGTGSTSSATTVTSPGTSKGSWGDMMTTPNTSQVNQARPLPIPEGQSGKLDAVSLVSIWLEQKLISDTVHTRPRPPINIRLNANSS
jgi:ribose 5-phosphate isomerase RpiB